MKQAELVKLKQIAEAASDYFEMCPLNWRVQETGPYSYSKYEETKEANMEFSKTFGPRLVKQLIDDAFKLSMMTPTAPKRDGRGDEST